MKAREMELQNKIKIVKKKKRINQIQLKQIIDFAWAVNGSHLLTNKRTLRT